MRLSLYRRHFILATLAFSAVGICQVADAGLASAAPAITRSGGRLVLVVGDSLSAEYGLKRGSGWVALLEQQLKAEKMGVQVVNASISGDTTSGGAVRLAALLAQHKPTHVVIELGANDALRGLPVALTQDNLAKMTQAAQKAGAKVLLVGMQLPPNYGAEFGARFAGSFATVAKANNAALVPFMLQGVADIPNSLALFQADRVHPKAEAHPIILANIWPELKKILK